MPRMFRNHKKLKGGILENRKGSLLQSLPSAHRLAIPQVLYYEKGRPPRSRGLPRSFSRRLLDETVQYHSRIIHRRKEG
jgi:hypothetical protein